MGDDQIVGDLTRPVLAQPVVQTSNPRFGALVAVAGCGSFRTDFGKEPVELLVDVLFVLH